MRVPGITRYLLASLMAVGLVLFGLPATASANHPAGRTDIWIALLVFALTFLAASVVLALIDRRRTLRTRDRRKETRTP